MVKRLSGLKLGLRPPLLFGETWRFSGPLRRGDEVRCRRKGQDVYLGILGVSPDGWLLGHVITVGEASRNGKPDTRIGDFVQVRADRVLAVFRREQVTN